MRLNKMLQNSIHFANFANNNGVEPCALGELIALANRAFTAGERYCNSGNDRDSSALDRSVGRFEKAATALGFGVDWPGLWPTLFKDGKSVYLPAIG